MTVNTGEICSIDDCPKPTFGRTWCGMHYATWRKYGDPLHPVQRRTPQGEQCSDETCDKRPRRRGLCDKHAKRDEKYGETTDPRERLFWTKIDKNGPIPEHRPDLGPCWIYTGYIDPNTGYGQFGGKPGGKNITRLPHRIAYQYVVGTIPKGLHLDHLCRVRRCARPTHLEPVPPRENIARGDGGDSWGYVPDPIPAKPPVQLPLSCTEDDGKCGDPIYKRTICRKHYRRWLRDETVERPRQRTPEERFWLKVDKDGPIPEHDPDLGPCWVWTAYINPSIGYGQFSPSHGVSVGAHRYAYELVDGPIEDGLDVHHKCLRRACVRRSHLDAISRAENLKLRANRRRPE